MSDKSIWKSGVSQTVNFVPYIFCALFIGLLSLGIANTSTDDYTENPIQGLVTATTRHNRLDIQRSARQAL